MVFVYFMYIFLTLMNNFAKQKTFKHNDPKITKKLKLVAEKLIDNGICSKE